MMRSAFVRGEAVLLRIKHRQRLGLLHKGYDSREHLCHDVGVALIVEGWNCQLWKRFRLCAVVALAGLRLC